METIKNVLMIMGAASSIGKAYIDYPILSEYDKIILTETQERMEDLREKVSKLPQKDNVICITCDVRNVENIHKMMQDIREQGLFVKDFLYAIGINMLIPAFDITEEIWDKIMDINLRGYFFACQEVAKSMIQNENGGSIVGISSQHGIVANIDRTPYCTSKAGMIHLTKALALEWAKYNIRVNCVAPTFIRFEANENYLDSVMCQKQYLNQIPIHRYATPKDVANAVKFLLSEKSNMMTGQAVVLDGGWTIK